MRKNKFIKISKCLLIGLFSGFLFSSCAISTVKTQYEPDYPKQYGIYPSVELDIVGLRPDQVKEFKSYSSNEYFTPGNTYRKSLNPYTMVFSNYTPSAQDLIATDPVWKKWNKDGDINGIYFIANIPGEWNLKPDSDDPRKLNLPFDSDQWSNNPINVYITPKGLIFKPPKDDSWL